MSPVCLEQQGFSLSPSAVEITAQGSKSSGQVCRLWRTAARCTGGRKNPLGAHLHSLRFLHHSQDLHAGLSESEPAPQSCSIPTRSSVHPPPLLPRVPATNTPLPHTSSRLVFSSSADQTRLLLRSRESRQPRGHVAGSIKRWLPSLQV